uniref:Integrase core domain-containing protein n=1 Tax=Candidatus Kentrum sp. DK TaxID=2126562 RepID=A0A450RUY3_9GAMM|nr:MAG: Integrase core domain-containing protein [Candidatus Kentron sp. DK]
MTVTKQQIKTYLSTRQSGARQVTAAARAGFSERTGRRIDKEKRGGKRKRHWRTRRDPFGGVWEEILTPLLEEYPKFSASGLLAHLQEHFPGQYPDGQLRTLQRRVRAWRARYGPEREVMFRQRREIGRLGLSDFTELKGVAITIRGAVLRHRFYHFRLAFSGWEYARVVLGGESFSALAEGLREALERLGGAPIEHRTDSLTAAYRNLTPIEAADVTHRYEALCRHYGMTPTRNNGGRGHENGTIEASHGHLKRRVREALVVRGSRDFDSLIDYQSFIDRVVGKANDRKRALIAAECAILKPLPQTQADDYTELFARVTTSSTIGVRKVVYSVPSRLIGQRLRVHLYDARLVCYLGTAHVMDLPRVYPHKDKENVTRRIDYHHLIHGLAKKPMAFYGAELRDDILPNELWRELWRKMEEALSPRQACRLMVGALELAADHDCEQAIEEFLLTEAATGRFPSPAELRRRFGAPPA